MRWIPLFLASMKLQCNCGVAQIWILLSVFNRFTREAAWGFMKRLDQASFDGLDHLVMVKDAETTRCFAWNFIAPPCQGPNRRPSPGDLENLIAPLDSACCPVSHDEFPVSSFASPNLLQDSPLMDAGLDSLSMVRWSFGHLETPTVSTLLYKPSVACWGEDGMHGIIIISNWSGVLLGEIPSRQVQFRNALQQQFRLQICSSCVAWAVFVACYQRHLTQNPWHILVLYHEVIDIWNLEMLWMISKET